MKRPPSVDFISMHKVYKHCSNNAARELIIDSQEGRFVSTSLYKPM